MFKTNRIPLMRDFGDLRESLASSASSVFLQDVNWVCGDGVVRWNSLLLSQWSNVVRSVNTGDFSPSNPLAIIMPGAKARFVEKLLLWTTNGKATLSGREVKEASRILADLGSNVKYSLRKIDPKDGKKDFEERISVTINPTDIKTEPKEDEEKEVSSKGHEKDLNQNVKSGKKTWNCPLCSTTFDGRSSRLISHLCYSHYRDEMMELWGKEKDCDSKECPICKKIVYTDNLQIGNFRVVKISVHMGSAHGKLWNVASPEVKEMLKQVPYFQRPTIDSEKWEECLRVVKDLHVDCQTCGKMDLQQPSELVDHLAQVHHSERLRARMGGRAGRCKLCFKKVELKAGGQRFCDLAHLLKSHQDELFSLLPEGLIDLIKECQPKEEEDQEDKPVKRAQKRKPKAPVKRKPVKRAKKVKPPPVVKEFRCQLCKHVAKNRSSFKVHLSSLHFRQQLMSAFSVDGSAECRICDFVVSGHQGRPAEISRYMVAHVGSKHNGLAKVLPAEQRSYLESLGIEMGNDSSDEDRDDDEGDVEENDHSKDDDDDGDESHADENDGQDERSDAERNGDKCDEESEGEENTDDEDPDVGFGGGGFELKVDEDDDDAWFYN